MNLILLFQDDFISEGNRIRLKGRRFRHIRDVHRAGAGDRLCVGLCNGKIGSGVITDLGGQSLEMEVELNENPPEPLAVRLVLALPRPIMFKRIIAAVTSMGVKQIILFHSKRVEKSFWKSPALREDKLNEQMILGLEQARDTVMPHVEMRQRFKPFVEDELEGLSAGSVKLVAHPGSPDPCPHPGSKPVTLVVGPEGGLIDYEIEKLGDIGFTSISLGERILRVETAVTALLAKFL